MSLAFSGKSLPDSRQCIQVHVSPVQTRNVISLTEKVNAFAEKNNIPIVGEIPRSDEIIRWEDQGKTVIEGDENSEISEKFFALARKLLESEETEKEDI